MKTSVIDKLAFLDCLLSPATVVKVPIRGTLTIGREWSIGPRRVPEHMLFYLGSGGMEGVVEGRPLALQGGDFYWQQPGVEHHLVQSPEHPATRVTFFRIGFGDPPVRLETPFLVLQDRETIPPLLVDILQLFEQEDAMRAHRVRCLFGELFCRALRPVANDSQGLSPRQARDAMAFIRHRLTERYPIAELAARVKLNADYFSRRFKATYGVPPQTMIKQERIRLAQSLLEETNLSVAEVAFQLGYDEVSYFSNQFHQVSGRRPSSWKRGQ